jgi:DNA repair exonuclease SbcCD nuclease subunit
MMSTSDKSEMADSAVILAIGDIHLGTRCSGLPDEISSWGIDPEDLTPAAALTASIDFAIEQNVGAVLFAGDVVESTNARFEAIVPLEHNVRRLLDAGIQVIAVAGNHDVEALPRLAALIDGFELLGGGGQWDSRTVTRGQQPVAEIVGWSFGERFVRQSPLAKLLAEPLKRVSPAIPRIGLLHADLDASGGHYAPIRQTEMDNTGYDAWLLGHIHKPSLQDSLDAGDAAPSGYLGSLVGLDASETGLHGPWLMTVSASGDLQLAQVPLASLRWEHISVSIDGLEDVEDVPDRLLAEAEKFVRQLGEAGSAPRALGLRVRLEGASDQYDEIRQRISGGEWNGLGRVVDGTAVFINKVIDAMELRLDLTEIAAGDDPAALMAQRILLLQRDDGQSMALVEEVRAQLRNVERDDQWSPLREHRDAIDPLSNESLRNILLGAGTAALHAMLSQNADREPS